MNKTSAFGLVMLFSILGFCAYDATIAQSQTSHLLGPACTKEYDVTLLNVVDGDTMDILVDLGWDVQTRQRIRLWGVNAPEMHGSQRAAGQRAKDFAIGFLTQGSLTAAPAPDHHCRLIKGNYGRYIVDLRSNGQSLSQALMDSHNAVIYR